MPGLSAATTLSTIIACPLLFLVVLAFSTEKSPVRGHQTLLVVEKRRLTRTLPVGRPINDGAQSYLA